MASGGVTAICFMLIADAHGMVRVVGEDRLASVELKFQRGVHAVVDLITLPLDGEKVIGGDGAINAVFVVAKVDRRTEFQGDVLICGDEFEGDVNGVLSVRHADALFESHAINLETPNGQAVLEAKVGKVMLGVSFLTWGGALGAADEDRAAAGHAQRFGEVIEHNHAAMRLWECSDKQAMVAAGDAA